MKAKRRTQTEVVSDYLYRNLIDLAIDKKKKAKLCNWAAKFIGKDRVWDIIEQASDYQVAQSERIVQRTITLERESLKAEHNENQIELWIENVSTCDCCGSHMGCI